MRSSASNDLDLILDEQNVDFPALVNERLLSVSRDELSSHMTGMADGYCWLVSRHDLFVWKYDATNKGGRNQTVKRAVQLPLPTTGLNYCAKSVSVYQSGASAGVIAVSGEGNARHWPSINSAKYTECVLDLAKEVVLSVERLEPMDPGTRSGTSFVLTTTSGTVICLRTQYQTGDISFTRICSRDNKGIGRRLSSIIFGAGPGATDSARVVKSLLLWREGLPSGAGDSDDSPVDPLVLTLSPRSLHVFDLKNKSIVWTAAAKDLLTEHVTTALQRGAGGHHVSSVKIWFLDAAIFRDGILVLLAATQESSINLNFFLAHLPDCDWSAPSVGWFSMVPASSSCAQFFDIMDEGSFVGHVSLSVPAETGRSQTCEKTDGVLILHSEYVQSVYVPNDLSRVNELPLNKLVTLPPSQKMIGHATDERYTYVMMSDGKVSTVRLLPKGFEDGSLDDVSFMDMMPEMPSGDELLEKLRSAFALFSRKDIVQSSSEMQPLLSVPDHQLANIVVSFLENIVDQNDPDAVTEEELRGKKVICSRFVVFLKHMNVLEKIEKAKVSGGLHQQKDRCGASILAEMCERVCVALALRGWQLSGEDQNEALQMVCAKMGKMNGLRGDIETVILGRLLLLHQLPPVLVDASRQLLLKTKSAQDRLNVLQLSADLLLTFSTAIEAARRSTSSVIVPLNEIQWTTGDISKAFGDLCMLLLDEMELETTGRTERTRLRDLVVKLVMFHMEETLGKIDGHPVLKRLYELGEDKIALGLAERFKDFNVICRICLEYDKETRNERMNTYKMRFASSGFDLYLCQYLERKNMKEELLEQTGEQADRFLSSLDTLRWRRELQKKNYEQASHSLISLADREEKSIKKQKALYSMAKLASICADHPDAAVTSDADVKLQLIKHQEAIPKHILQLVYPANPNQPLGVAEMLSLYQMAIEEADVEPETFLNALHLLGILRSEEDGKENRKSLAHFWSTAVARQDWSKIHHGREVEFTLFGSLVGAIVTSGWSESVIKCALPQKDQLLKDCAKQLKENEKLESWIRRALDRANESKKKTEA